MRQSPISLPLLLIPLAIQGCNQGDLDAVVAPPVAVVATQSTAPPKQQAKPAASKKKSDPPKGQELRVTDQPAAAEKKADYAPPFPDRVEMFAAPRRNGALKNNNGEQGGAVELMGFSTLDKPRALLLLNGEVSTLAEGDKVGELEVVSIQPPTKVVLQQGRQRTQLSLEN